ncbi:glycoside hydrolase family 127 protein [Roseateles paludis]|uniref:Glycoside hydrolase family 127 protein n=1 Tax=Roseateles paludis TaxID=3145238 RepID=A0ABV0G2L9_9BURK
MPTSRVFKALLSAVLASAGLLAWAGPTAVPLDRVRLLYGPFYDAQQTDLRYLMALDPERLLAPFKREAGLPVTTPSYGNWESSGLDGHMGGHYLSALALMWASTGNADVKARLDHVVAELKRCQDQIGTGYLGGIPKGAEAWNEIAAGNLKADNFGLNGRWVPWYNLHKLYAGLRDAWRYAGNAEAKGMLVRLSDWAERLTAPLTDAQMQDMLRAEHGGMNEVFADVAEITGDKRYLALAQRFSHRAVLQPLAEQRDQLTGLHANTQIPKVIGYGRMAELNHETEGRRAAEFFWHTVVDKRSVAIGGNSVREHFHPADDFKPMVDDVEGPETCNSYNMLRLTALLHRTADGSAELGRYADYYERTLYNHILASQHPEGGFVYFTPMRPQHYRVYSQVDQGMWCCVGSGIESHARHSEFIYSQDGADKLYVNLFVASSLDWRERGLRLTQSTNFPDEARTQLKIEQGGGHFTLALRYPGWVAAGALRVSVNGKPVTTRAKPGDYVEITRDWQAGDRIALQLPMRTHVEPMPALPRYVAVLHGPIVLAAKTDPRPGEALNFKADDSRMGHAPHGPTCPQEAAPIFVGEQRDIASRLRPVPGQPLNFTASGLVRADGSRGSLQLMPFFRLHDSRYMLYWPQATQSQYQALRVQVAQAEAARRALDAITVDQVAPGEQQPEVEHAMTGDGTEAGIAVEGRWRHARQWFSYELRDLESRGRWLRLWFAPRDAGRRFDVVLNDRVLASLTLEKRPPTEGLLYSLDLPLPADLPRDASGKLRVKFVAQPGSMAGGLYGLRLLSSLPAPTAAP